MNHRNPRTAVRLGMLPAGIAIALAPAFAGAQEQAEESATTLDRIQVTGSRIRQVDIETAQPIMTIGRQEIESQGFASVADILQNISAAGSPSFSRASPLTSNQEAGGQYIDLRNLGAQRTLVLVNGKRLGITPDGFQDLSSIPMVMVDRVEVLKDGASSIYGSDAMAGVINIITRKNFDGAQANAYFGQYGQDDGEKQSYDFMVGFSGDKGSVTVGAEYHKEEAVWAKDRWFSDDSYPGYPQYSTTVVGQWGNWREGSSGSWNAPNRGSSAIGEENFHPQNADDTSKPSDQMQVLTPLERHSLYVNANYDINEYLRFTSDIGFTQRTSQRQIAGYPLQSTAVNAPMSADSYFSPTGDTAVNWRRRGWEVPRLTDTDVDTWRFTAGLEGAFQVGERWFDWDAGMLFNDNDVSIVNNGNFYIPAVRNAVGPSFVNAQGVVQCGTPEAPIALTKCVPWNPYAGFGTGAVANSLDDPAVRDYLFREEHATGSTTTRMYFANFAGSLFTLPAGDLGFAVGVEHREEEGGFSPDAIAQSGDSTNLASGPTYGEYKVDEVYAELNIPVLAELPFAKELTFSVASRYSDFDTFGETTNSKLGMKWRPMDDLLVRATWAEGFRAPTIGDLYGGGSQTFTTGYADPCDSVYGVARGSARCLQDVAADYRQLKQGFVPTTSVADQTPVPFTSGSNPNLQPESSESSTIGLVYSPSYVQGLSMTLDWWSIKIDDTMVSDSPNQILQDCYVKQIESRCALFSRDPVLGIVNDLTYGLRNAGYTETEGFDFDVNYALDTDFGRLNAKWASTYVSKYESTSTDDEGVIPSQSNGFGSFFRVRSNLNLGWSLNDWSASWGMRYYSGTKEECYFEERCNIPDYQAPDTQGTVVPMNRVGSTTFHDVQLTWKAPWNANVSIGANNVFEKYGPVMYSQPNSNFSYYGGYDIGRFVYMKYQQNF